MNKNIQTSVITSIYRGRKYLIGFFDAFLAISNLEEVELVIIHNDPQLDEIAIINEYRSKIYNLIYISVPREGVYRSWNRAIENSSGKYLAIWNVDDIRTPNSLSSQSSLLNNDENIHIVSGDYIKIFHYGDKVGYLKKDPVKRNKLTGITKFNNGCFLMWRKDIHSRIGYFDEQLKIGGDWDFWMRLTSKYGASRVSAILGYYLWESTAGISKIKSKVIDYENPIITYRYEKIYITNIYRVFYCLLYKKPIIVDKILNFDQLNDLIVSQRKRGLSIVLSLVFFWQKPIIRYLIRVKYSLIEKSRIRNM